MSKVKRSGVCKLTQIFGPYVDSHIIPLSLTRLSRTGEKAVQVEIGKPATRKFNGWYDGELVTKQGETILADIDTRAIDELRALRLIWSGWGIDQRLISDDIFYEGGKPVNRLVELKRSETLRIFFLSLVWRAAVSNRAEFDVIALQESVVENLRNRVLSQDPGPSADFPIQLFQIITRGLAHNRTPLLERKTIDDANGSPGEEITYVRFYFDGLVAHVHIPEGQRFNEDYLKTCLGYQEKSIVFVHEFEDSRTSSNIREMAASVYKEQGTVRVPLKKIVKAIRTKWPEQEK